jgi:hypothetical protein
MPKGMTDPPEGELKHSLRTSANLDKETMMLKYQDRIENVIAAYEQLIESRESLLLRRGKVRTSAIRVQAKRIDTGNTEVELMDRLRVWMSSINQNIPSVVSEAYTNLVTKRNDLAVSEDNYLQAERQLTGIEWSHIDEDSDFYQFDLKERNIHPRLHLMIIHLHHKHYHKHQSRLQDRSRLSLMRQRGQRSFRHNMNHKVSGSPSPSIGQTQLRNHTTLSHKSFLA